MPTVADAVAQITLTRIRFYSTCQLKTKMRWRLTAGMLQLLLLAPKTVDLSVSRATAAVMVPTRHAGVPGADLRLVLNASRFVHPCWASRDDAASRRAERQQRAVPESGGVCAVGVDVSACRVSSSKVGGRIMAEGVVMRLRGAGKAFKQRKEERAQKQRAMLKAAAKVWACALQSTNSHI